MKYYNYIILDPRKPGRFTFDQYTFLYEPIYIGKGSRYRTTVHFCPSIRKKKHPLYNKLNKIFTDCGFEAYVVILETFESEDDAFAREVELIAEGISIGVQLTNICPGGRNSKLTYKSNQVIQKRQSKFKGVPRSQEVKQKISQTKLQSHPAAKRWVIVDPQGNEYKPKSLRQHLEMLGFSLYEYKVLINCYQRGKSEVAKGKMKGWKIYHY